MYNFEEYVNTPTSQMYQIYRCPGYDTELHTAVMLHF